MYDEFYTFFGFQPLDHDVRHFGPDPDPDDEYEYGADRDLDLDDEYDVAFKLDSDGRHELPLPKGLIAIVVIPLVIWLCWIVGPRIIFEMTYPTVSYAEDWSGEEVDFPAVFEVGMMLQDPFGPMARAAQMFYDAPYGDPTAWHIWLASCHLDIASLWWETQVLQLDPMLVLAMAVQQAIVGLGAARYCIPEAGLDLDNTLRELGELVESDWHWTEEAKRDLYRDLIRRMELDHYLTFASYLSHSFARGLL